MDEQFESPEVVLGCMLVVMDCHPVTALKASFGLFLVS
jgi:hypothetical protein